MNILLPGRIGSFQESFIEISAWSLTYSDHYFANSLLKQLRLILSRYLSYATLDNGLYQFHVGVPTLKAAADR